ncbi:MAG: hypothetical protein WC026_05340 [Hyphomicrobium sp.]
MTPRNRVGYNPTCSELQEAGTNDGASYTIIGQRAEISGLQ